MSGQFGFGATGSSPPQKRPPRRASAPAAANYRIREVRFSVVREPHETYIHLACFLRHLGGCERRRN